MSEGFPRREFLAGVLATGTLSAAAMYLVPGGRRRPPVTLTLMTGADPTGGRQLLIDMWNQANPDTSVGVEVVSGATLDQRDAMISAAQNGSADVLNLDIIHIPHFAQREYITAIGLGNSGEFLPATLSASRWNMGDDPSRVWAVPFNTDVGMVFERLPTDADSTYVTPPLAEVIDTVPDGSSGFAGQLRPASSGSNEVFAVNVFEHALSRNDTILDASTGTPSDDLASWQDALAPLRAAIGTGRIRVCDDENDTTEAFRNAGLRYMRNWPREYRVLQQRDDPEARASRIRVSPLPTGILGGQSLALVSNSPHSSRAEEFIRFLTDTPAQRVLAAHGLAPTRTAAYTDEELLTSIPHLEQIRGAVERARLRPVHPEYGRLTEIVATHVSSSLHEGAALSSGFIDRMQEILT